MKRTYREAVDIAVKWWSEKSFRVPLNQDNGDKSNNGMAFLLLNFVAISARDSVSEDQIKMFEDKLTQILLEKEDGCTELDKDYNPNKALAQACEYSGISPNCLPCKTHTFINENNEVEGRFGYGSSWFKL